MNMSVLNINDDYTIFKVNPPCFLLGLVFSLVYGA
jgi:hypothetical protein